MFSCYTVYWLAGRGPAFRRQVRVVYCMTCETCLSAFVIQYTKWTPAKHGSVESVNFITEGMSVSFSAEGM